MKYTVQRGDTLWLIARRYGVSLDALIAANPNIADPDYIQVGLIIEIPRESNEYVVKKGDTMWLIAKRFGVSLDDLIKANTQISDPNKINVGDVIYIPEVEMEENDTEKSGTTNNNTANIIYKNTAPNNIAPIITMPKNQEATKPSQMKQNDYVKNMHYVVKTGDTLFKIAKMFGITLQKLIDVNKHIENPDKIYPGNKIKIPVEKEYFEKKYYHAPAPTVKPNMVEMSGTTPAMPMKPAMPVMPSTQEAMPAMPGMQEAMPAMNQNCPMMHQCPCMHMMHMMQPMHMMHHMPMMDHMNMEQPMHPMHQMHPTHQMDMEHSMHHMPNCQDMMHQMHHSSDKGCK